MERPEGGLLATAVRKGQIKMMVVYPVLKTSG